MAFARALGAIQSVGRGVSLNEQSELYDRGQSFTINGNPYRVENVIAKGGFGTVFLASNNKGRRVAVKIMLSHDSAASADIDNEIRMMKQLQHENIIQLYDASCENRQSSKSIKEYKISMEYCKFSIADVLVKYKEISVNFVVRIILFTTRALVFMHGRGVIHRDIKAENLLINEHGKLKLCDFGSATTKSVDMSVLSNSERLAIQEEMFKYTTPITRSPEVCDVYSNWPIGKQQDNWAMGCLIYFVCFGDHPFDGSALAIINGKYKKPPPIQENQLSAFAELIAKCLVPNPDERITAEKLESYISAAMQKNPVLGAKKDFADILDLMAQYCQQEKETEAVNRTILSVQDKLFSNFTQLKNTVVQHTNKLGSWTMDTVNTPKTSQQPVTSPKPPPRNTKPVKSAMASPPVPPHAKPFEAEWPTESGSSSNDSWDAFPETNKTVNTSRSNVFDPFAEQAANIPQKTESNPKHSEDLLSLQAWPGTVHVVEQNRSQSSRDLFDFDDIVKRHSEFSQPVLQPTKHQESGSVNKLDANPQVAKGSTSTASLDDMVSQMMQLSTSKK